MSYLNETLARSIAQERERDTLLTLRRQQLAARPAPAITPTVTTPRHQRWHAVLVRLHASAPGQHR